MRANAFLEAICRKILAPKVAHARMWIRYCRWVSLNRNSSLAAGVSSSVSINRTVRHSLVIPQELAGIRLDQALGRLLDDYSRSLIKQWIDAGQVRVNDAGARPRDKTKRGDRIEVIAELQGATGLEPQEVAFGVVYADDDIVVIDKPAGVVVHPGAGNPDHTLVNGLLRAYPELAGPSARGPRPSHRQGDVRAVGGGPQLSELPASGPCTGGARDLAVLRGDRGMG